MCTNKLLLNRYQPIKLNSKKEEKNVKFRFVGTMVVLNMTFIKYQKNIKNLEL